MDMPSPPTANQALETTRSPRSHIREVHFQLHTPSRVSQLWRWARQMRSRVSSFHSREVQSAISELLSVFRRNGYVRNLNLDRRRLEGQGYKKGYEIRFIAESESEADRIRR